MRNDRDEMLKVWFEIQDQMLLVRENQFDVPHEIIKDVLSSWLKELNYFIEQELSVETGSKNQK